VRSGASTPRVPRMHLVPSFRLQADAHVLAATSDIPEQVSEKAGQLRETSDLELMVLGKQQLSRGAKA
jgi:hypothetical protein